MEKLSYDKTKIGKKIATGGDRKVYLYDNDKVIKISTLSFFVGNKLHEKLHRDYLVSLNYFKDYVVKTTDVSTSKKHIEIQPLIHGELLRKKHTENPYVKKQLKEIHDSLTQMVRDGYPALDLVGNMGMIKSCLSNIMVDSDNKLNLIDNTLLEGKTVMPFGIILEIIMPIIRARQNYLLRQFLK